MKFVENKYMITCKLKKHFTKLTEGTSGSISQSIRKKKKKCVGGKGEGNYKRILKY